MNLKLWISQPSYVLSRLRLKMWESANPHAPWLTSDAVNFLEQALRPSDAGIEFGSGRSTIWFAKRIKHLTSVEHNEIWYNKVQSKLNTESINNVKLSLSLDEIDYVKNIHFFEDGTVDFCLIDGIFRGKCALAMIEKMRSGGIMAVDNADWFLAPPTWCKAPAIRTPDAEREQELWTAFEARTRSWRRIWTSNGVTATALFIVVK